MPKIGLAEEITVREFAERVSQQRYTVIGNLKIDAYITKEPVPYDKKATGVHKTLKIGDSWGELFDCAWMNLSGTVSQKGAGKHIVLIIDINGEACVFDRNGNPYRGLTTKASDYDHNYGWPTKRILDITKTAKGNENIDIWMDAGCNDLFGNLKNNGRIEEAYIAIQNDNTNALYFDLEILKELSEIKPKTSAWVSQIREAIYNAALVFGKGGEDKATLARKILKPCLDRKNGDYPLTISFIGHAHIDLAWLWPIRETIRKGARTFSTVMRNMEKYPHYKFVQSQAQIYAWMKEYYPDLYSEIKQKIKEGRWEPNGSMWVEPDCNIPSGESFIRQFFYGKKFFREEFGIDTDVCFLPDTFGYSGALPQILRDSEVPYFTTQKLSWNKVNKFPYQSFTWEGNDGSKVLAHMLPEECYLSSGMPRAFKFIEENYKEKDKTEYCLALYGIGDGGGGPSEDHIERLIRQENLFDQANYIEETTSEFFEKLKNDQHKFGTWKGEMYLEFHQGTLTTQARNKKYNRKMEFALREAEMMSAFAMQNGREYPEETIENIWKEVLLYQFHDILPGSSIQRVYEESLERYAVLDSELASVSEEAKKDIYKNINTEDFGRPILCENTLGWEREEFVKTDNTWMKVSAPAIGYRVSDTEEAVFKAPKVSENGFENSLIKVQFSNNGAIKSIYDKKAKREVLKGESNVFILHTDQKDAWDMYPDYDLKDKENMELISQKFGSDGPVAFVKQTYRYNDSVINQTISLTDGSKRIDFETDADWHETDKQLRVHFDFDIFTDYARSEIQFGNVKRPNHTNTGWDQAKYETCAHKWIDLSERNYGVALLNDCKYAHRALGGTLSMSLLRSTNYPGVNADHGRHSFRYAIFPHEGDYTEAEVVREGFNFNVPLSVRKIRKSKGKNPGEFSYISCSNPSVVIDTVKKADRDNDIIVRVYECHETSGPATLNFGFDIKSAKIVNLLENDKNEPVKVSGNTVTFSVTPFKIVTLKIQVK
ncbi:MAG: alpha-mannosidase, partial [Armatimonadetes bacterium]|nr:alpha-mannosidase [Candidatus Hippobium faecium]